VKVKPPPETGDSLDALDLMLRHAADRPDAVALKDEKASYSYAELLETVKATAGPAALARRRCSERVVNGMPVDRLTWRCDRRSP